MSNVKIGDTLICDRGDIYSVHDILIQGVDCNYAFLRSADDNSFYCEANFNDIGDGKRFALICSKGAL